MYTNVLNCLYIYMCVEKFLINKQEGKRSQGGQKKRYKDTLKTSLRDFDTPFGSWEQSAQERSKWRGLINKGAALCEKKVNL